MIEASSQQRAVHKAPTSLGKIEQGKVFAVSGFSLHPSTKNHENQPQHRLKTSLTKRSNIVIWLDLLNTSLFPHERYGSQLSTPEKLLEILETFRKQVSALVYIQCIGTPFIDNYLITAEVLTINPR